MISWGSYFFSCIFTLSSLIQNCSINNSQFSLVVGADESEHWSLLSFLFTFQIGALKILKEISRNCIIRKAIADLGGEEGPRASWSFQGKIVSHVAVICLVMQRFYVREVCSVTAPVSEALWWRAGKGRRACNYVSGSWMAPLIPLWLPVDWALRFLPISISHRLFWCRYSNSLKFIRLLRVVFSSQQHVTEGVITTRSNRMKFRLIFKFQRRICKLSAPSFSLPAVRCCTCTV